MKILNGFIILILVLIGGLVATAFAIDTIHRDHWTWRYKMIVEIQTPEGIKTGEAVRQIDVSEKLATVDNFYKPRYNLKKKVKGEAVVVDLGGSKKVFALIDGGAYNDVVNAFNTPKYEQVVTIPKGSKAELREGHRPMLVAFKDISDPKSVEIVKGARFDIQKQDAVPVDNFKTIFGDGYALKSVQIEITDEPVTEIVVSVLPWLPKIVNSYLDGQFTSSGLDIANSLHRGNFKIEDM